MPSRLISLLIFGYFALASPSLAQTDPEWTRAFPPFRIIGNIYWVGSYDLSTYLITTPQGHILINTGVGETAKQIKASVEQLGFKLSDTKILTATHGHFDHVAGLAELKRMTGARLIVSEPDKELFESGGRLDFRFGDTPSARFEPVKVDGTFKDSDTIALGGTVLTAHHHPGHTKGATSFTLNVQESGKTYRVVIANMGSINPGVTVNGMPKYPGIGDDYAKTFKAQKDMQIDVWLASHASQFKLHEKYKPGDPFNPERFVDPNGFKASVEQLEKVYREQLARERAGQPAKPRGADGAAAAAIDAIVEKPIKAGKVAGASVAVTRRGETIVSKSFGSADLELDVPMPADASFEIGSVTKQFTAASILLLAERGKLSVDDDVTKYLPDYPTHGQRITIRHLLTHTSGIKGYTEMAEFADLMKQTKPKETLVKLFGEKPLDFAPGQALVYNNSAYFLLGLIIEKLSGQTYADFVKTNLFDKVGMPNSYYCSETAVHHHHAHGYDTANGTLVLKGFISHTWPYSAGSLCSTAADLSAWLAALHGGRVLSPDSYRAMTTPTSLADGTQARYGFGVGVAQLAGRRAIFHGGGINGFLSEAEYFPESDLSIVVLLNTAGPVGPSDLAREIADAVLGPVSERSIPFTGDLSAFAGTFEGVGRGRPTTVTISAADGGVLTMKGAGPPSAAPQTLTYRGGDTFAVKDTLVIFEREGGRVVRLRLDAIFGHYPLKKKTAGTN